MRVEIISVDLLVEIVNNLKYLSKLTLKGEKVKAAWT